MPSHYGIGLDEHERRAPVPPRLGQDDPKQPISPPELWPTHCAFQRVKLLAEREVLEDQFVVSAAGQRQRADEYNGHLQHMSILPFRRGTEQPSANHQPAGSDCGEGQRPVSARRTSGAMRSISKGLSRTMKAPNVRASSCSSG